MWNSDFGFGFMFQLELGAFTTFLYQYRQLNYCDISVLLVYLMAILPRAFATTLNFED